MKLSHIDSNAKAQMVNVGTKAVTNRTAVAAGRVNMKIATLRLILSSEIEKGDVLTTAKLAGIGGAKLCSSLIPLCHNVQLDGVNLTLTCDTDHVEIKAYVEAYAKTGVEMEALTAVAVAALTIYDMAKAVDREMTITDIRLLEKHGGKSGDFVRGCND